MKKTTMANKARLIRDTLSLSHLDDTMANKARLIRDTLSLSHLDEEFMRRDLVAT